MGRRLVSLFGAGLISLVVTGCGNGNETSTKRLESYANNSIDHNLIYYPGDFHGKIGNYEMKLERHSSGGNILRVVNYNDNIAEGFITNWSGDELILYANAKVNRKNTGFFSSFNEMRYVSKDSTTDENKVVWERFEESYENFLKIIVEEKLKK